MTTAPSRARVPDERFGARLESARRIAAEGGLGALLIGVGPDLRYLTGYAAMPLERLTMLVVPSAAGARPSLVVPRLEVLPAQGCPAASAGFVDLRTWDETESAHRLVADLVRGAAAPVIGVSDTLWASHLLRFQEILPATFRPASTVLRELRMVKDPEEIALLREAGAAADRVVDAIAAGRLVGRSEADVAREVRERLVAEGHDLADFAIVGSGPNSASPHHGASDRLIGAGEPIVLDIGGPLGGYGSDTTRMIWVTGADRSLGPSAAFLAAFAVLRRAQAAATAAVRPGVTAESIDAAARDIIAEAGYGDLFIHRTGHGIGLEAHEDPYIVSGSRLSLAAGMAFSIEPGIYREGEWGMRLEDIVVCGPDGPDVLNRSDLDLRVVAGT
ncbi:MAG TPA: Xaa-Pro peptidase family protein [Candidatus Limnocylindrales bacterium]